MMLLEGSAVLGSMMELVEHPAPTTFPAFPSALPPSPTVQADSFSSYQAPKMLGGTPRQVSFRGNMKRRVSGGIPRTWTPLALPFKQVTNINLANQAQDRVLIADEMRVLDYVI